MSDITTKLPARTVAGQNLTNAYRGWKLVCVGGSFCDYFVACKGSRRVPVGAMRHGDSNELYARFRAKVNEMEARQEVSNDRRRAHKPH